MRSKELRKALLDKLGTSPQAMYQRADRIKKRHGPMSTEDAICWIAVDKGIDVSRFLDKDQLDRVRQLRSSQGPQATSGASRPAPSATAPVPSAGQSSATPAAMFKARSFHAVIIRSSRKLFVDGHRTEAIHRAFQRVNNRVKKLSGITGKDGQGLMADAFRSSNPPLQMTDLTNQSEVDEHDGTRFLMMGAMTGLRNPRVHEDRWEPDNDIDTVLDALSFASLLHRILDRCEAYRAR